MWIVHYSALCWCVSNFLALVDICVTFPKPIIYYKQSRIIIVSVLLQMNKIWRWLLFLAGKVVLKVCYCLWRSKMMAIVSRSYSLANFTHFATIHPQIKYAIPCTRHIRILCEFANIFVFLFRPIKTNHFNPNIHRAPIDRTITKTPRIHVWTSQPSQVSYRMWPVWKPPR